ncbi:phosphoribosylformylglycinamidine synthase subunit PurQ [Iodidimonas muriae]|uniref:Phosphoribosylformylglycinamidine synthase subunit PurQ n=1 Tax=Iodidimonas muriae TaxID=261467 RepID=A0ABQ2LFC8_9PROT|nr:phosphoribosylformylglycinamidine synthase subunit PurQ [Iodidimonas muriae]GER07787.1 phosphoribosylformylglycinamidine synthase subunit PurQ [Kordiimonadales bacterium JCM 17843]GGO15103.1 phosphoribosylformylglycinamidine synthase subunit PurQ [Iodidimonas muriae]
MKAALITFPGSNCDRDMAVAIKSVTGRAPIAVWHSETTLGDVDFIALPGGFSYGDYLRCGAIAARSGIIPEIIRAGKRGVPILGICNGFQILTEIGLLPGALMRNAGLHFICRDVPLRVETSQSVFTGGYRTGSVVHMPVAHHDGNYFVDPDQQKRLDDEDRIAWRYCTKSGEVTPQANINGSVGNIAGVLNESRTILGMMPHPERMIESAHGGTDGRPLFESALSMLATL